MQAELKEKWIAALESGDYKQGHGYLCRENRSGERSYCCLGVLCEVAGVDYAIYLETRETSRGQGFLTTAKAEEFGLLAQSEGEDIQHHLATMNDGAPGNTNDFHIIANWIRDNIPVEREVDPGPTQGA